jgi:hypothetical protein
MSPFSAPFSWGTRKRRLLLPKRAAALSEGTQWGKGGTGKAEDAKLPDTGISLKRVQENEWQKKGGLLNWEDRCGIGRTMRAGKAEQKKSAVPRSPQLPQWRSIQGAAFCGRYFRVADDPIEMFVLQPL